MDKDQRKRELSKDKDYLSLSANSKKEFEIRLAEIRKNGYEIAQSEITMGVTDVAVTIGNSNIGIFGALAISSLTSISKENKSGEFLIEKVTELATKINGSFEIE